METNSKDHSIIETVLRRRKRSSRLSELARELGREVMCQRPLDAIAFEVSNELSGGDLVESKKYPVAMDNPIVDASVEVEVAVTAKAKEESMADIIENEIDEGVIGDLGVAESSYGMLDELIPQLDFNAIPFTQPNRVLAKSRQGGQAIASTEASGERANENRSSSCRKKNPVTLLDSYFKGL